MKNFLVVMNGRSIENIIKEAEEKFPGREIIVVYLEDDRFPPPANCTKMTVIEIERFLKGDIYYGERVCQPDKYTAPQKIDERNTNEDMDIVLIANGGTTNQLVPVLLALTKGWGFYHGKYTVVNLQPDYTFVFDQRMSPLKWHADCPVKELSYGQIRDIIGNTSW